MLEKNILFLHRKNDNQTPMYHGVIRFLIITLNVRKKNEKQDKKKRTVFLPTDKS